MYESDLELPFKLHAKQTEKKVIEICSKFDEQAKFMKNWSKQPIKRYLKDRQKDTEHLETYEQIVSYCEKHEDSEILQELERTISVISGVRKKWRARYISFLRS